LSADLSAIRLASVQAALAENPELALDILGFDLGGRFCKMLDIGLRQTANRPENDDGFEFPPVLEGPTDDLDFEAYRQLPQAERNRRLVRGIAVLFTKSWGNQTEFEAVAAECGADARKVWTPTTEGFWKRITAGQMDAIIRSLLGWTDDCEDWKAFSRMKKAEKAAVMGQLFIVGSEQRIAYRVTPEQAAAIDAWTPAPLQPQGEADA
jgi:ParB family chromosome partitioning protein